MKRSFLKVEAGVEAEWRERLAERRRVRTSSHSVEIDSFNGRALKATRFSVLGRRVVVSNLLHGIRRCFLYTRSQFSSRSIMYFGVTDCAFWGHDNRNRHCALGSFVPCCALSAVLGFGLVGRLRPGLDVFFQSGSGTPRRPAFTGGYLCQITALPGDEAGDRCAVLKQHKRHILIADPVHAISKLRALRDRNQSFSYRLSIRNMLGG